MREGRGEREVRREGEAAEGEEKEGGEEKGERCIKLCIHVVRLQLDYILLFLLQIAHTNEGGSYNHYILANGMFSNLIGLTWISQEEHVLQIESRDWKSPWPEEENQGGGFILSLSLMW